MLIDIGNLWDVLTAIGTIGATVMAVVLAVRSSRKQLDCALVWDSTTELQPKLVMCNTGMRTIVIKSIKIKYKRQNVLQLDMTNIYRASLLSSVVLPNQYQCIEKLPKMDFPLSEPETEESRKKQELVIETRDIDGTCYISKQETRDEELSFLLFGQGALSDD